MNWIANYTWDIADDILRDLRAHASRQQLTADFDSYLRREVLPYAADA